MADVRLVDLAVIKLYSLAVRQEWAPAEEVLAALDQSRQAVLEAVDRQGGGPSAPALPPPGDPAPPLPRAAPRPRRTRARPPDPPGH